MNSDSTNVDFAEAASQLVDALTQASFSSRAVAAHLGPDATAALFRGEPGVVRHACADDSTLSRLIRFVLLREPTDRSELGELLAPADVDTLIDAQLMQPAGSGEVQVAVDVRPHLFGGHERVIISDLDASVTEHVPGRDHVLGVGSASLSLLSASPTSQVETVLDLGTGSGVQAIAQSPCAQHVVATDIHPRALELAKANLCANGISNVELRRGPWFEPVDGQRFDRIVANPPFVVGPPVIDHVYRDSGLDLDGASQLVVSQAADHLTTDGTAYIVASWVDRPDQPWQSRVASWLPDRGVSAWILQRDQVDPGLYTSTWLRDESVDPRSVEGQQRTERWLEHFDAAGVSSIGVGWVCIRDIGDAPSEITAEELTQPFSGPLGPEVEEYFARMEWLRSRQREDVLAARYLVRPGVAIEEVSVADAQTQMGFECHVIRLSRTEGPRFSHEIDEALQAVVSGLHPEGLALGDVVELYCASHGLSDADAVEVADSAAAAVVDLIRHGLIIPAEIAQVV